MGNKPDHIAKSKKVKCPKCGGFYRSRGLKSHMRMAHGGDIEDGETQRLKKELADKEKQLNYWYDEYIRCMEELSRVKGETGWYPGWLEDQEVKEQSVGYDELKQRVEEQIQKAPYSLVPKEPKPGTQVYEVIVAIKRDPGLTLRERGSLLGMIPDFINTDVE